MADAIEKQTGHRPQLLEGHGGVFDVKVDGKLIYSKDETGRFPEDHEVLDQLQSR